MSALRDATRDLAEALGDDLPDRFGSVHDHVPDNLEAPCLVLQPADRYVTGDPNDETFGKGEHQLALDVWCVVEVLTNEQAADDLGDQVEHVLDRLPDAAGDWGLDAISRPGPIVTAGWSGHGCRLTVSRHITL